MKDNLKCPSCGHEWQHDLAEEARKKRELYRGEDDKPTYLVRVECPNCAKNPVFSVEASRVK